MSCSRCDEKFTLQPVRLRCYHFNKVFQLAFHSPQTRRLQADSIIVRMEFKDGSTGFGESAPRPYVTGETCRSVVDLIVDHFASILFKQSLDSLESVATALHELERHCLRNGLTAYHSALGAIDLAMLNALEGAGGILERQRFLTARRDVLRRSLSVPYLSKETIQAYFPLVKSTAAVPVIKVLVSDDAEETYERVKLIRCLFGPDTELRIEFNGKMPMSGVKQMLHKLAPFGICAVEQPLPAGLLDGLHRLRHQFGVSLVADESLITLEDARRLAEHGAYNIFNIKVSKCGGLLQSRRIAQMAEQHGILCQVGTHVGESDLLGQAGRRLARSIPNFDCYGGGSEVLFSGLMTANERAAGTHRNSITGDAWRNLIEDLKPVADIALKGGPGEARPLEQDDSVSRG